MNYTDTQLKQALAKMLPDIIDTEWTNMDSSEPKFYGLVWKQDVNKPSVKDTELLHLCWMVEETLNSAQEEDYIGLIVNMTATRYNISRNQFQAAHATWQQRVIALAKVKGIDIV